ARGQVRKLEDRFAVAPPGEPGRAALEKQIIDTSLRFGVLSRFTAFVAVDRGEGGNEGGGGQQGTQPGETPEGWQAAPFNFRMLTGEMLGMPTRAQSAVGYTSAAGPDQVDAFLMETETATSVSGAMPAPMARARSSTPTPGGSGSDADLALPEA